MTAPLKDLKAAFDLIDTKILSNGVIVASYRPTTAA